MNSEDAFTPTTDRAHFFASSVAEVALAQLQQGLDHERPVTVLTGEPGIGKSSAVREACARWGARVRAEWLLTPGPEPELVLPQVVELFGGNARGDDSRRGWIAALSRTLGIVAEQDELPLLIVEDAHTLSTLAMVEIASIQTAATEAGRSLRIILVGLPELDAKLEALAVDSLAQLVGARIAMAPLPAQDVRHYLHHRVGAAGGDGERMFSRKAARELHTASNGVPGPLDQLAIESIRAARKSGTTTVGQEHVRAAVMTLNQVSPAPPAPAPARAPRPVTAAPARAPKPAAIAAKPAPPPPPAAAPPPPAPKPVVAEPKPAPPAPPTPAPVAAAPPKPAAKPARPAPPAPAPPPPPRRPSPLDSRHPRVKEWVSRFTEDDIPTRFDMRTQLPPMTDPEELPSFREPDPVPRPVRKAVPAPEPIEVAQVESELESPAYTPEPSEPEQVAIESAPAVLEPGPIMLEPEPIVLAAESVTPIAEPEPQPKEDARGKRKKKRERERAAAKAPVAPRHEPPAPAPVRAPAPPEPARAPVAAAAGSAANDRAEIADMLANYAPPIVTVTPAPPPNRKQNGPRAPAHSKFMQVIVPGALMLGVAAVAIMAGTRGGFEHDPPHTPTQASSIARVTPTPAPAPAPALPPTATPPQASVPPAESALALRPATGTPAKFCLAVGTYLFSDRARLMARQLDRRTGLDAWVETVEADGTRNYRILIGGFASESDAEKVADKLLGRGLVSEAMVQPMPAGHASQ